ncbi:MAG: phosphate signaling complex protein PhoU [Planctomycetota bacterium]|jgi:phosphate transport system protein
MAIDLQTELTEIRRAILNMSASVEQRVNAAIDALLESDVDRAREVRGGDDEIDEMDLDIETECLRVLALSQPVAGDLRFVLSVMRINSDLERVADLARSLSKRVISLSKRDPVALPPPIRDMAERTRAMVGDAIAALADENADLAKRVRRADDRVDDLHREMFAWVQEQLPSHVDSTRALLDILSASRKLERMADLATNIAEDVVFLVEGAIIRHQTT